MSESETTKPQAIEIRKLLGAMDPEGKHHFNFST